MKIIITVAIVIFCLMVIGCGHSTNKLPTEESHSEMITFNNLQTIDWNSSKKPEGAQDLIKFAISLSQKNKHESAAQIFLEAKDYSSSDNQLLNACLSAAALEFLKAGERIRFKFVMQEMQSSLSSYEKMNPSRELEILLALDGCKSVENFQSLIEKYNVNR